MVLLDTNYLIRCLVRGSEESGRIIQWVRKGQDLCTSSVCWYEFLCGPVDDEGVLLVSSLLDDRIIPYTADQAAESSRLFNGVSRKRHLRVDALIAAAAILSSSRLATGNTADFAFFKPFGLILV